MWIGRDIPLSAEICQNKFHKEFMDWMRPPLTFYSKNSSQKHGLTKLTDYHFQIAQGSRKKNGLCVMSVDLVRSQKSTGLVGLDCWLNSYLLQWIGKRGSDDLTDSCTQYFCKLKHLRIVVGNIFDIKIIIMT